MRYGSTCCEVLRVGCPGGTDGRREHLYRCDVLSFRSFEVAGSWLGLSFFCCDSLEEIKSPRPLDLYRWIWLPSMEYSGIEITWVYFGIQDRRAIAGIVRPFLGYLSFSTSNDIRRRGTASMLYASVLYASMLYQILRSYQFIFLNMP